MATRKPIATKVVEKVVEVSKPKRIVNRVATENIRAMDFVPVWQSSETADDCNEHFGRSGLWASSFASRLRKMGVNLKKMERRSGSGKHRIDVDELNALID
jgi:hypothetical protein